jgi:hypothetical protein
MVLLEGDDGVRLESFKMPAESFASGFSIRMVEKKPSEILRSQRFATIDELTAALRRELTAADQLGATHASRKRGHS